VACPEQGGDLAHHVEVDDVRLDAEGEVHYRDAMVIAQHD
jgi:hypothetical protein